MTRSAGQTRRDTGSGSDLLFSSSTHSASARSLPLPVPLRLLSAVGASRGQREMLSACFVIFVCSVIALLASATGQPRKRVFYLNSYHEGYGSSDDVMRGIRETISPASVELKIFLMDTKRRSAETEIQQAAHEALQAIRRFQPEVIIASDDAAVKYVIAPHFKNGPVPVVFCGVNWSAKQYGLPTPHVTGMLEVVPMVETITTMRKYYPSARRLFVLTEESVSEQSNRRHMEPLYRQLGLAVEYAYVTDYAAWKRHFIAAQRRADLIYLPTNGAVKGWDDADARGFLKQHIRKPVVTCDDFMMPYAVFGLTKVAREQGVWAAQAALSILDGKPPHKIDVTKNQETKALLNRTLAAKIGFTPDAALLKQCAQFD